MKASKTKAYPVFCSMKQMNKLLPSWMERKIIHRMQPAAFYWYDSYRLGLKDTAETKFLV